MAVREFDVQQVCLNGHQITARSKATPQRMRAYCEDCGAPTTIACAECKAPIPGSYPTRYGGHSGAEVPEYCSSCGKPFAWLGKRAAEQAKSNPWGTTESIIKTLCDRFHTVARQLRTRHNGRHTLAIADEYDVQDLMHALLRLFFDDVRPEEWAPSYGAGAARMDFLLKHEQTVLELKKTRPSMTSRELVDELTVDIVRYKTHPDCGRLVCFAYDPEGHLGNPTAIEQDLSGDREGLAVSVLVRPAG